MSESTMSRTKREMPPMTEAQKLATFFLQSIDKTASGPDYAAAWLRIVRWFEGDGLKGQQPRSGHGSDAR